MDEHNANSETWEDETPITPANIQSMAKYDVDDYEDADSQQLDEATKTILDFAVNNKNLARLEVFIGEFNPFKILGIADFEIRHSNVLGWLIDPNAHHSLGDTLFKNLLLEVLKDCKTNGIPHVKNIVGSKFTDLKVMREWSNIDILAVSPMNKLAVVIENKWGASEGENQLDKYAEIIDKKYVDYKKVFVFLTIEGTPPKGCDRYIPFAHRKIYEVVKSVAELRRDFMHVKVYDFIGQYLQILEEKTMQNEEFISLCGKLYSEHKEAIHMIMEHGKPTLPISCMQDFHTQTDTDSFMTLDDNIKRQYVFNPKSWTNIVPMTNLYSDKYLIPLSFHFGDYDNHVIVLYLWIGNFPDQEERKKFLGALKVADKDSKLNFRTAGSKTTTIFSKSISLKHVSGKAFDLHDYETVRDKLIEVYNSPDVQDVIKIVDEVVKKFNFNK